MKTLKRKRRLTEIFSCLLLRWVEKSSFGFEQKQTQNYTETFKMFEIVGKNNGREKCRTFEFIINTKRGKIQM